MRDIFAEVLASMSHNKMRLALTGFAIGWGIFILIVLMGAGNGLLNGMTKNFSGDNQYTVTLTPGTTSIVYGGFDKGRGVTLYAADTAGIHRRFPKSIDRIMPVMQRSDSAMTVANGINITLMGEMPGFEKILQLKLLKGRLMNESDMKERGKICVINKNVVHRIFNDGTDAIGKYITIHGTPYLIVGVSDVKSSLDQSTTVYIPESTFMSILQPDGMLSSMYLTTVGLNDSISNNTFTEEMQEYLASTKGYSPEDSKAIVINNPYEQYVQVYQILHAISAFLWLIGIATLFSGIVGIANIMLIAVKERTRELGVRKAMGASDGSIITLVLLESVIITFIFGYIGMMVGVGLTQLLSMVLANTESSIFSSPTVPFEVIIAANIIMVIAGLIAGYIPAKHAVNIKLVDALNG